MSHHSHRTIYVGMHDGVCAVTSEDDGKNWRQGPVTTLPHAASRLTASPVKPERAYLAAYEAGVYRTDDAGLTWRHIDSYPTEYAHSVLAHPVEPDAVYAGSEPAAVFQSKDAGESWQECQRLPRGAGIDRVGLSRSHPRLPRSRSARIAGRPQPPVRRYRGGRHGPIQGRRQ